MFTLLLTSFVVWTSQAAERADATDTVEVEDVSLNWRFRTTGGLPPRGGFDIDVVLDDYDDFQYETDFSKEDVREWEQSRQARRLQFSNDCPLPPSDSGCHPNYNWQCGDPWVFCGSSCNERWDCICDKDIEGNPFCWQNNYCSQLQTGCTSTSQCRKPGTRCVTNTCCGPNINVCIEECEEPNCPTSQPNNECPCRGDYWSCQSSWFVPKVCGDVPNSWFRCHCVPEKERNEWQPNDPNDNSCVENNWCRRAPNCNSDLDCDLIGPGYECIPNTCCRNRKKCVRCCRNPY